MNLLSLKGAQIGLMAAALVVVSNFAMAESVPALKYRGKVMSGNTVSDRDCEFVVAIDEDHNTSELNFILGYGSDVHGVQLEAGSADFYYFDATKMNSGNAFYSVDEEQGQSLLTLNRVLIHP